jgi:hypothetical protein
MSSALLKKGFSMTDTYKSLATKALDLGALDARLTDTRRMDAYGIDIRATVTPLGFKIEFDQEGHLLPAWYSMVLVA